MVARFLSSNMERMSRLGALFGLAWSETLDAQVKALRVALKRSFTRISGRVIFCAALGWLGLMPMFSHSQTDSVAGPASLAACAACHGAELQGSRSLAAPNLSVLGVWYVERQLRNYKRGLRAPPGSTNLPGRQMQPLAAVLDEAGIIRAAQLVEVVPERLAPATVDGDAERGAALYRTCTVCHGARAEGNQALNAPRLAGQNDWYLVSQLRNYRAGVRGVHGDIWGAQMRAATGVLVDDAAVLDVVAYINTLVWE